MKIRFDEIVFEKIVLISEVENVQSSGNLFSLSLSLAINLMFIIYTILLVGLLVGPTSITNDIPTNTTQWTTSTFPVNSSQKINTKSMSPKNRRTRSCYGPPEELPNTGDFFTLKNVLAGFAWEKGKNKELSNHAVSVIIQEKIRRKWLLANPKFAIHQSGVLEVKICRAFEKAENINIKKKVTKRQKDVFLSEIDKLFDVLVCQCSFMKCSASVCCSDICTKVHIKCTCERQYKVRKE